MNPHRSAAIIIFSFRHQAVRDLAWTCFSPPLVNVGKLVSANSTISGYTPLLTDDRKLWLDQLDDNPAALVQHLTVRPTHRLGVYFEQLWHFFLQHDTDTDLIAHNLAVRDGERTLGEFDCLFFDRQRQCHVHLELAVKYFLGVPQHTKNSPLEGNALDWLGPDQKDRLATKLDQLLQRQILLSDNPAARSMLGERGICQITKQIALKGYLFQPTGDALPLPPGYNNDCPLSYWVTLGELDQHCTTLDASTFTILPKRRWLSPAQCDNPTEQLSLHQLKDAVTQQLNTDDYPLLVAALDGRSRESSRFFVTPTNWPDRG